MKRFCLLWFLLGTSAAIFGADNGADGAQPPVLRKSEPADNVVFTLPGRAAAPAAAVAGLPATEVHLAPPADDKDRPVLRRPKREYPAEFERDSADYLNGQIGIWQQVDAQALLGEPVGERPSFSDDQAVNGHILAFTDPTGKYSQLELDFDSDTGLLRTLFAYPQSMTWQECRYSFGANVRTTQANKGRTFYSYLDRRLDVLVDANGKVVSLGMY
jgi:hypothetical protein